MILLNTEERLKSETNINILKCDSSYFIIKLNLNYPFENIKVKFLIMIFIFLQFKQMFTK